MKETFGSSPFTLKDGSPTGGRPTRRRTRSSGSSSGSSLSTSASPAHHHSIIPFSWEQHPGVPKKSTAEGPNSHPVDPLLLPLPPPLRSSSGGSIHRRKQSDLRHSTSAEDPFAAALEECARDRPAGVGDLEDLLRKGAAGRRGSVAEAICGRLALVGLYGSCKAACSVADSTIRIPRSDNHAGSYSVLLNRRAG